MRKKLVSLATAAVAVALLAGCSGGGSSTGGSSGSDSSDTPSATKTVAAASQTKAEACAQVEKEFQSFVDDQTSASAPADPKARAALVTEINDRLDASLPGIGNATVKTAFEHFNSAAKDYAAALRKSGSEESADAQAAETDVQTALKEVATACPS
ncbi:hypothetical protein [Curtobacterium pusillum]|uniref:hypothetical protein n=1 Tax=Curtobacterium pusillum TaxID=69373 RepID=UPI00119F6141|nr:hypothetical protein [Curtobacterium pusillum]